MVNITSTTKSKSRWQGHTCKLLSYFSFQWILPDIQAWTDCVFKSFRSSQRSLFNIHLIYSFFLSLLCLCLPLIWCASFLLQGSLPSLFTVLILPVGSELRERIIEGFEPSSFCSYYPLSSAISAPAHPSNFLSAPLSPIDLAGRFFLLLLLPHSCLHSFLKRFPPSFISDFFSGMPLKKHRCQCKKMKDGTFFKDKFGKKLLWHLCDIFCDTLIARSEGLPLFRHQVVQQKKALRWVWQIRGCKVIRLAQRWLRRENFCLPVFVCLWVYVCRWGCSLFLWASDLGNKDIPRWKDILSDCHFYKMLF